MGHRSDAQLSLSFTLSWLPLSLVRQAVNSATPSTTSGTLRLRDLTLTRQTMSSPALHSAANRFNIPSPNTRTSVKRRKWDDGLPPLLRPLIRAYLLAYASSVVPRIVSLLIQHLLNRRKQTATAKQNGKPQHQRKDASLALSLRSILQDAMHWQRFPTFCAVLVGGSTLLEVGLLQSRFVLTPSGINDSNEINRYQ